MRLYADKNSDWGKDSFNVSNATKDEMDNRDRKSDFNFSHKKGDYNVVGLNVTKVSSEMIPAIENWVKSMENKLNQIDEDNITISTDLINNIITGAEKVSAWRACGGLRQGHTFRGPEPGGHH